MGCGSIKTNESNDQLQGHVSQSELLPVVRANKKSDLDENNSISHQNSEHENNNNNNSLNKNEVSDNSSKKIEEPNKSFNSLSIKEERNKESKIIEQKKEKVSKSNDLEEIETEKIKNSNNNNGNNENDIYNESDENDENNENKETKKEEEKEINNKIYIEKIKIENALKNKSHTTDNIPKYKSKLSISNIEEKLPKVIQNNTGGYLDRKIVEIEIKASRFETIFPIWIQKEEEIEFIVSGKWKINNEIECDSKGIEPNKEILDGDNINNNKFNDGALIGRILKGTPFVIYDGLKYTSDISGPLILKMNSNSLWTRDKPEGILKMKIYGASKIENADDLEEKIGWWKQLRIIDYNNKDDLPNYELALNEKSVIILFNKLRHDSILFTNQYLENYQKLTPTTKKIYNQFISNKDQFIPLKINLSIIKLLEKFYDKMINDKNNIKEDDWIYILRSEKSVENYLEESFNNKKKLFASIIRYYEDNPFFLGLRILFRDNIRNNLLNYNFSEMSMITLCNDLRKDGAVIYYCIVVLSNQNGNDNVNYNIDMNIEKMIENEKKIETNLSMAKEINKNLNINNTSPNERH